MKEETVSKYSLINRLLLDEYAIVQINTAASGIVLPQHLLSEPTVALKLSKLFAGGMEIDESRIIANLSFNKEYFSCTIPLSSIWSVTSVKNQITIWPEDAPAAISEAKGTESKPDNKLPDKSVKKKPQLKRIK